MEVNRWNWVFALVGITALLGGLASWWVLGAVEGSPTWFLAGGAASLLLWAALDRHRIAETVRSRSFVHGTGSGLMVLVVAAIGVASYLLAREHDRTFDLTRERAFSLSDHTLEVLSGLDAPVRVIGLHRHESPEQQAFRDLARRYAEASPQVQVEYVDPLRSPRVAERYGVTSDQGVIVLESGDREQRIESAPTEDALTKALVVVSSDTEHRICWSVGHGEPDPDDERSERGMGAVVTELERLNYTVTPSHIATGGVDRACDALILARPTTDLLPPEREALAAYLAEGGRALLLLEPGLAPGLVAEMPRYGVSVGDDVVLDFDPRNTLLGVDDPSFVVLTGGSLLPHPITRDLSAAIVLGIARSAGALPEPPDGLVVDELLRTSAQAWAETEPDALQVQPDEGERVGHVPVAVAVRVEDPAALGVVAPPAPEAPAADGAPTTEGAPADGAPPAHLDAARGVPADFAPEPGGRLVVLGDSDFASNVFVAWGNNRDLFLNAVAWLVDEERQIGERPEIGDSLEITAVGEAVLCLLSIFVVPGGAAFLALTVLLRRRTL